MNVDTLREALGDSERIDIDALYARFASERSNARVDDFLFHLFEQGLIGVTTLARVADLGEITVTGASELGAGAGEPRGSRAGRDRPAPGHRAQPASPRDGSSSGSRYERIETIAQGGMGAVQLARDRDLQRYVAYKHIRSSRADEDGVLDRFVFEAQVTAQLDHPNIVPIYSLDTEEPQTLGYAMKLVQGRTLAELIVRARADAIRGRTDEQRSLPRLLEHFLKVCDAVHYAHSKGVLHRDLKPHNVLVGRYNEVYVVDWGIAKVLSEPGDIVAAARSGDGGWADGEAAHGEWRDREGRDGSADRTDVGRPVIRPQSRPETSDGEMLGTPGYMSPEQAQGRVDEIDARSEVFTLGLMLYEIATLRPAYPGGELAEFIASMSNADISPVTHVSSQTKVPRELSAIVTKACSRDAADRYPDVAALAEDVRRFMRGQAVSARPESPLERLARWMGGHREATLFAFIVLVLASVLGALWGVYQQQQTTLESRLREQKLAGLVSSVAERAQRIERHFLEFESAVEGLAAATAQLMTTGAPAGGRFYTSDDYATPGRGPPDLVYSPAYMIPVSLDWPVYKLAPDVAPDDLLPYIRQVNPLRHYFKQTMFESVAGTKWLEHPEETRREIIEEGAALTWIYVGLAPGIHLAYPGKTGYPREYDPRRRPWYVHSIDNQGTAWLPPYVDVLGRGLVLPCTRPVRSPSGELLGVAGAEMTLAHVQRNLLDMKGYQGIRATYLVDDMGRVVAGSGHELGTFALGTLVDSLSDLDVYPHAAVVDAVRRAESGQMTVGAPEEERIVVYQQISSVRWYLVAEADADMLPEPGRVQATAAGR